jgi:hypothetical protein
MVRLPPHLSESPGRTGQFSGYRREDQRTGKKDISTY